MALVVQFLGNKTTLSFDLCRDSDQRLLGAQPFLCSRLAVSVAPGPRFCAASATSSLNSEREAGEFRAQPLTRVLADAREVQTLAQSLAPRRVASPPLSVKEAGEEASFNTWWMAKLQGLKEGFITSVWTVWSHTLELSPDPKWHASYSPEGS